MKPLKLTVIPQEERKAEFAIDEINREPRKLHPPHFPDASDRYIVHGTLLSWLKKLAKKD